MLKIMVVVLPIFVYLPVKANLNRLVGNGNKPRAAAGKPVIGKLGLPAVNYFLFEDTVLIAYGIACCGIIAGCQTVHIASRQSAQTAVAETRVGFLLINSVQLYAHIPESLLSLVLHTQIVEAGLERAPHKELHRQVVYLLSSAGVALAHRVMALFLQMINHNARQSAVYLRNGRIFGVCPEIVFQDTLQLLFQLFFSKR